MLKNIPYYFTPDLLKLLMSMGHGDDLLLSDGNYPAHTMSAPSTAHIYLPVREIDVLLTDILHFFPLDESVSIPLLVMESAKESGAYERYQAALEKTGIKSPIGTLERFDFYKQASTAAGIIITACTIKGGNILIKKGVVR